MSTSVIKFRAGLRIGRLILRQKTRESPKVHPNLRKQWVCDCDCGGRVTVPQMYLARRPNPKENCGECNDLKSNKTIYNSVYRIWLMMLTRCNDPRHVGYHRYGGRGIKVCEEWSDPVTGFDAFLAHIGPRPSTLFSVDRYPDPDGPYAPGNVRWATHQQQADNKSKLPKETKVNVPQDPPDRDQLP